ncbi:hypothetical protein OG453_44045 [Streptomyces sp. NBC_01381]|uniref:hypothetical protein n=1 Tax=Streptomyces sp. NBC_01381 TaxID=2903845 RepID=UPI002257854F|nr:hypothetical protein [Streptomyces sp. NBC_01381]MCX4673534.1 hypothetical protein [Streptomyces sp. NBC_01381]
MDEWHGGVERALVLVTDGNKTGCGTADEYCDVLKDRKVPYTVLGVGNLGTKDVVDGVFGPNATVEQQDQLLRVTSERTHGFSLGMGIFIAVLLAAACAAVADRVWSWSRPKDSRDRSKHGNSTRGPAGNSKKPHATERTRQPEQRPAQAPGPGPNHKPPPLAPSSSRPARTPGDFTAVYTRHRNVGWSRTHVDATGGYAEFGDLVVWVVLSSRQPGCLAPGSAVQVIADGGLETGLTVTALPGHDGAGSPHADGAPHRTATSEGEISA